MRACVWLAALAMPLMAGCVVSSGNTPKPHAPLTRSAVPSVGASSFDYQFNENAPPVKQSHVISPGC
jgi:hypothetical protein